jgi:anti-sigma factor RsiW
MGETAQELTCRELVELVTEYFEGALPERDCARFEAHVAECEGCEAFLAQMRATITLARASAGLEDRPEVAALLEAFRDFRRRGAS